MTSEEVEAIVNPEEETEDTSRIPEIISLDLRHVWNCCTQI